GCCGPGDGYRSGPLLTTGAMVPTVAPSASRLILACQSAVTVTLTPTFIQPTSWRSKNQVQVYPWGVVVRLW
ncbi:hypothetical protein ACFQ1S_38500, partial [Kibdelosporangium lantanae]